MATTEQEAELIARLRSGERLTPTAKALSIPLTTAWEIRQRHNAKLPEGETIPTHDRVVAEMAGEIQMEMLDYMRERMEAEPDYAWKNGITINAIRGTAVDKIIKREQMLLDANKPTESLPPMVIFVNHAPEHPSIEGPALHDPST